MKGAAPALLILGLGQMAAELLGIAPLKALFAATTASPAPKVFSSVKGLETYSTRFFLEWTDRAGAAHSIRLTPELYARIRGPYNRRNVYGAVLAYGPVLASDPRTKPMFESVARYALCGEAPLLRELGLDPTGIQGPIRIRLEPIQGHLPDGMSSLLVAPCR